MTITKFLRFATLAYQPTLEDCRQFAALEWSTAITAAEIIRRRGKNLIKKWGVTPWWDGDWVVGRAWLTVTQVLLADEQGSRPDYFTMLDDFENWERTRGTVERTFPTLCYYPLTFAACGTPAKTAESYLQLVIGDLKICHLDSLAVLVGPKNSDMWLARHASAELVDRLRSIRSNGSTPQQMSPTPPNSDPITQLLGLRRILSEIRASVWDYLSKQEQGAAVRGDRNVSILADLWITLAANIDDVDEKVFQLENSELDPA